MSDRRFFTETGGGGRRALSGWGLWGCNHGDHVKPHLLFIIHRSTQEQDTLFSKQTFSIPVAASVWAFVLFCVRGEAPVTLFPVSTFPKATRVRQQGEGKIRWWGWHRASSSWKMLLIPSDPAVLFPCRALKLLKLTYYLLDWANMFVFCVHVCASACSPPFFLSF